MLTFASWERSTLSCSFIFGESLGSPSRLCEPTNVFEGIMHGMMCGAAIDTSVGFLSPLLNLVVSFSSVELNWTSLAVAFDSEGPVCVARPFGSHA